MDQLPSAIFKDLNCGVALIPDTTVDNDGLLILGQYHVQPRGLGRYITIHYGSIMAIHGHLPPHEFRDKIKEVLHHELTHHIENLAGDRSLEIKDAQDIARMRNNKHNEHR